jgi:hypothetical protein
VRTHWKGKCFPVSHRRSIANHRDDHVSRARTRFSGHDHGFFPGTSTLVFRHTQGSFHESRTRSNTAVFRPRPRHFSPTTTNHEHEYFPPRPRFPHPAGCFLCPESSRLRKIFSDFRPRIGFRMTGTSEHCAQSKRAFSAKTLILQLLNSCGAGSVGGEGFANFDPADSPRANLITDRPLAMRKAGRPLKRAS